MRPAVCASQVTASECGLKLRVLRASIGPVGSRLSGFDRLQASFGCPQSLHRNHARPRATVRAVTTTRRAHAIHADAEVRLPYAISNPHQRRPVADQNGGDSSGAPRISNEKLNDFSLNRGAVTH